MPTNKENITVVTRDELRHLKGETDYARLDAMTDDDIAKAVAADPSLPPLDVDWTKASLVIPPGKDVITLRLDRDVLDWFRAQGKGYQTRINQVLRAWKAARTHEVGKAVADVEVRITRKMTPASLAKIRRSAQKNPMKAAAKEPPAAKTKARAAKMLAMRKAAAKRPAPAKKRA